MDIHHCVECGCPAEVYQQLFCFTGVKDKLGLLIPFHKMSNDSLVFMFTPLWQAANDCSVIREHVEMVLFRVVSEVRCVQWAMVSARSPVDPRCRQPTPMHSLVTSHTVALLVRWSIVYVTSWWSTPGSSICSKGFMELKALKIKEHDSHSTCRGLQVTQGVVQQVDDHTDAKTIHEMQLVHHWVEYRVPGRRLPKTILSILIG